MARACEFKDANTVLKPAPGDEDRVDVLPIWTDSQRVISCWQLTPQEIAEIVLTGKVFVQVLSPTHPPICIHGNNPFRS